MQRRTFLTLVGGAAAWPLHLGAQQAARLPTIGFLGPTAPAPHLVNVFVGRLRELGWIEGRNLAIEYRWAEGRTDRVGPMAAELVRLSVDVLVTSGTPAVLAAKRATTVIPIVFVSAGDPVGTGLVTSLAHPGGNATGFSLMSGDIAGKRLELLSEMVPALRRLGVLANMGFAEAVGEMSEVLTIAKTLGREVSRLEVRNPEDIALVFAAAQNDVEAVYVCGDPLMFNNRATISTLALNARLPTMFAFREHVEAGGLISYGTNFPDLFRRAAEYVDKILRGTKPTEIPVEQPTKFDLVINLRTAKALGIMVPEIVLARANAVIE